MLILTDQLIILLGLRYLRAVRDQTRRLGLPSTGHFVCDRHREWHGQRRARGHLRQDSVARGLRACTGRGLRPRPARSRRRGCRRGPCVGRDMLLMRDMILNDTIRTLDGWTRMYDFFPMSSTALRLCALWRPSILGLFFSSCGSAFLCFVDLLRISCIMCVMDICQYSERFSFFVLRVRIASAGIYLRVLRRLKMTSVRAFHQKTTASWCTK